MATRRRRSGSGSAAQPRLDHEIVLTARLKLATGDIERVRTRDRRDRALASREPARRAERRLGLRQPDPRRALGRRADRSGRPSRFPRRGRLRLRQARQLHPGRGGRDGSRRQSRDRRRSAIGSPRDRVRTAQRGASRRVRREPARDAGGRRPMADSPKIPRPSSMEPARPDPEDVPDVVLEELLAAFSKQDAAAIDFDDPSIDRLLGLGDSADSTAGNRRRPPTTPRARRRRRDGTGRCHRLVDIVEHGRARLDEAPAASPLTRRQPRCRTQPKQKKPRQAGQGHRDRRRRSTRRPVPRRGIRIAAARRAFRRRQHQVGARRSSSRTSTRAAASKRCRHARRVRWILVSAPGESPCAGPRDASG